MCPVTWSCPTLYFLMECSPPGSSVHEIFQAGILEWVVTSYSKGSSQPKDQTHLPHLLFRQADSLPLGDLGSPSVQ